MDAFKFTAMTKPSVKVPRAGLLASLGLTIGIGSVFASSCCVIPLTLAALGVGAGTFGVLEALAPYRWPLVALGFLVVSGAWFAYLRRPKPRCATGADCAVRRSRGTGVLLAIATAQVFVAVLWTSIEPSLVRALPWL